MRLAKPWLLHTQSNPDRHKIFQATLLAHLLAQQRFPLARLSLLEYAV
jgi:hypothetical protein